MAYDISPVSPCLFINKIIDKIKLGTVHVQYMYLLAYAVAMRSPSYPILCYPIGCLLTVISSASDLSSRTSRSQTRKKMAIKLKFMSLFEFQ